MAANSRKTDVLLVKKDAVAGRQFHYSRDERLALKGAAAGKEMQKRQRVRKLNTALLIVLGACIAVLVFVLLFKYVM